MIATGLRLLAGVLLAAAALLLVRDGAPSAAVFGRYAVRYAVVVGFVILGAVSLLAASVGPPRVRRFAALACLSAGVAFLLARSLDFVLVFLMSHDMLVQQPAWPQHFHLHPYQPHLNARRFNSHLGAEVVLRTNRLGFRGGPPRDSGDTILLLGDSVMFGLGIPEGSAYAAVLERMFNGDVQVLNGAWPGASAYEQEQALIRFLYRVPGRLRAVVVGYLDNDPPGIIAAIAAEELRAREMSRGEAFYQVYVWPFLFGWDGTKALVRRSLGANVAKRRPQCVPAETMDRPIDGQTDAETFRRGLELELAGLRRIAAAARLAGAQAYVVYFPWNENSVYHFRRGTWMATAHAFAYKRIHEHSQHDGYYFVDGLEAAARHLERLGLDPCNLPREYYSRPGDFAHSSPLMATVIAERIYEVLQATRWRGDTP